MAPVSKAIVFTDFDGTITLEDSNNHLFDHVGFGKERRLAGNTEILEHRATFRDEFRKMIESVAETTSFDDCIQILRRNIKLDPGFNPFYSWCLENNIPVIVLSSGMEPIIRALLKDRVGPAADKIPIVSNQVKIEEDGKWQIVYHDDSEFGHDKSLAIKPYRNLPDDERPITFYCGDGASDLSAARETDLLFAKAGQDLIMYCERENVPFTVFHDFTDIHKIVQEIVEGKTTIAEVIARPQKEKDVAKEKVKDTTK